MKITPCLEYLEDRISLSVAGVSIKVSHIQVAKPVAKPAHVQPLAIHGLVAKPTHAIAKPESMVLVGPTYLQDPYFPLDGLTPPYTDRLYAPWYANSPIDPNAPPTAV